MSCVISVYLDDETEARLLKIANEKERTIADLAESAIAEAALNAELGQ